MGDFLLDLYACSPDPGRWRGALDRLCELMSVRSAVVQVLNYTPGGFRPVWTARDSYSEAHKHEHDRVLNNEGNPRLRVRPAVHVPQRPIGVARDEEIFPAGSADLQEIQRRRRALRFGCNLGGMIELNPGRHLALVLHRSSGDDRPLGMEQERLVIDLMPHLRQTIQLSEKLIDFGLNSQLLIEAVNISDVGVLLCDSAGRTAWANRAALAILETSPFLRLSAGFVRAMQPADSAAFRALLDRLGDGPADRPAQMTIGRANDEKAVQVMGISSIAAPGGVPLASVRQVALLIRQPGRPLNISPACVAQLFGMSSAEARLTAGLCDGLSLGDYARQRGISEGTARIQLKSVLAKTGSRRQAELVRRVCASLAVNLSQQISDVAEKAAFPLRRPVS